MMRARGHDYRLGRHSRSLASRPGVGGTTFVARLACGCGKVGDVNLRQVMPPEHIDQKFKQLGWGLDPARCPDCLTAHRRERKNMATKPSPAAMRAQAQMIGMLSDHFDPEQGAYLRDWSDQKIATTTGIALELVIEYRRECFGELKEPDELRKIRDDINALEELQREQAGAIAQGLAELRGQLAKASAKWAA